MKRLALLLVLALGCATVQSDTAKSLYSAAATLSALENSMAAYCESTGHDVLACEKARTADERAYGALKMAQAVYTAGQEPDMHSLNLALAQLYVILGEVGAR